MFPPVYTQAMNNANIVIFIIIHFNDLSLICVLCVCVCVRARACVCELRGAFCDVIFLVSVNSDYWGGKHI